jgi:creatinine amidohydrolase
MPTIEWATLTWPEAEAAVARMPACILPFGAVEAHGYHGWLSCDTLLSEVETRRVAAETGVILLPAMPYGQVWSLQDFPGSLSLSIYTLIAVTKDLIRSLRGHGFRLVFIHSGHLGNVGGLKQAMRECHDELPGVKVVLLDCLNDAVSQAARLLTTPRSHPALIHCDEIETSMLLEVAPAAIHMERAVADYPVYPPDFDLTPTPWSVVTKVGVLGDPTAATLEKGRAIVDADVAAMVAIERHSLAELGLAAAGAGGAS